MISGTAAIAGIGATEFSKDSGRSELRLAAEATLAALADAGLRPAEVDGLVTFSMDSTAEVALARELGLAQLSFFSHVGYGGGAACATVQQAALAIAAGIAEVVVCYRALNERSGHRFGQVSRAAVAAMTSSGIDSGWHYPVGLGTPAATVAMIARRYMHDCGATSQDFGAITVADRRHAATNPGRVVLPAAGHPGRPSGVPMDRGTAPAAGLLPGERRRGGRGGDQHRAGP
jgi:acetyl-CoA acetyltransferase